jgi:hypothetical protein
MSCCVLYRLLFCVELEDVSMPFNPNRGPHVTSCDPGYKDFNLNSIYSSNEKDNQVEQIWHLELCAALLGGLL